MEPNHPVIYPDLALLLSRLNFVSTSVRSDKFSSTDYHHIQTLNEHGNFGLSLSTGHMLGRDGKMTDSVSPRTYPSPPHKWPLGNGLSGTYIMRDG
jgi:hypothetical protein